MRIKNLLTTALAFALLACQNQNTETSVAKAEEADHEKESIDMGMHPDWTLHSSIYEINIRQHTPEGTLNAMREKLPELQKLGVKILWLMPVQPIGQEKRKGGLGSYYSIQDYTAVNPEFGTMDDFKDFVTAAHDLGFKVILDWVANHTAWDAVWMKEHKDWYTQKDGKVIAPVDDWSDVADLNYNNMDMRQAMLNAMKFWVDSTDIDGFRCDVAYMVPMEFWNRTREALDSIKPVFMLAEAEGPEFHEKAFDMTYGWELHHLMNKIAKDEKPVAAIDSYIAKVDTMYPDNAFKMYFTTNHDENSWNGTVYERMGNNAKNFFLLSTTLPHAMPLVYSGQAYGLNEALAFFEKDTISGTDTALFDWYKEVIELKMNHPALMMEPHAGDYERLKVEDEDLFAFTRTKGEDELLVVLNFSDEPKIFGYRGEGGWNPVIDGEELEQDKNSFKVPANGYILAEN